MIGERIKKARAHCKLSQVAFGKAAGGVSKSAVSQWERGLTKPERDALLGLQRSFSISPDWIMEGRGEMISEKVVTIAADDAQILALWHSLIPGEQAEMRDKLEAMAAHNREAAEQLQPYKTIRVADRRKRQVNFDWPDRRKPNRKEQ